MKSRYEESKARTRRRIKEARDQAYKEGFEDGKKSVSANKRSAKSSSVKQKNKSKS